MLLKRKITTKHGDEIYGNNSEFEDHGSYILHKKTFSNERIHKENITRDVDELDILSVILIILILTAIIVIPVWFIISSLNEAVLIESPHKHTMIHGSIQSDSNGCQIPNSTLKIGDIGNDVFIAQKFLRKHYAIDINGKFSDKTRHFVRNFQKKADISVDGVIGRETWQKLICP